jgi:hypothetical protein
MASGRSMHYLSKPPDFPPENGCADFLILQERKCQMTTTPLTPIARPDI